MSELRINSITFTGKIADIQGTKAYRGLLIKSLVSGKMLTEYPVFIRSELFDKLNVKIGDEVCVLGARFWQKEEKYRFQVSKQSQIRVIRSDEMSFSYSDFSGVVTYAEEEESAFVVHIEQCDGKKRAEFLLVMKKSLYEDIIFTKGDEVIVSNAQAYKKDGKFRFRIATEDQVYIARRGSPDLGVIRAEDKFI